MNIDQKIRFNQIVKRISDIHNKNTIATKQNIIRIYDIYEYHEVHANDALDTLEDIYGVYKND